MPSDEDDVVIRVGVDISDALAGINRVEQQAAQAEQSTSRLQRLVSRVRAAQIGAGARTFGEALASGAPIGEAALSGLSVAFPEAAVLDTGINLASSLSNRFEHVAERLNRAQRQLKEPESAQDVVEGFRKSVELAAKPGGVRETFRTVFDTLTQGSIGNRIEKGRERRRQFRDLVRSNPADAALVLAAYGNSAELRDIYDEEIRHSAAASAYRESQRGGGPTNITINGLSVAPNFGTDVEALIDRANRNNGYRTVYTLPSGG